MPILNHVPALECSPQQIHAPMPTGFFSEEVGGSIALKPLSQLPNLFWSELPVVTAGSLVAQRMGAASGPGVASAVGTAPVEEASGSVVMHLANAPARSWSGATTASLRHTSRRGHALVARDCVVA